MKKINLKKKKIQSLIFLWSFKNKLIKNIK